MVSYTSMFHGTPAQAQFGGEDPLSITAGGANDVKRSQYK